MRFFKALIRYKLIKNSDEIEAFLQNYSLEKRELLKKSLAEILAVATEKIDIKLLKTLLLDKVVALNIDVNAYEIEAIYIALAKKAAKKIGLSLGKDIKFSFDSVDTEAISAMRKGFYWMGKEYNENLQERLKDLIEKTFNGSISQDEIGGVLKEEFGTLLSADESYFKGVSDHIALQAQNVATVTEGSKYGVEHYKILAIMDTRTTEICRSMHGRIIPAKHLKTQAEKILGAKSLADKKAAAAWQSKAYNGKSDKMSANFGLPPYHFRCRTEAVPVWIGEEETRGVKMKNTSPLSKDEVIRHIDKTGVERVLTSKNAHDTVRHSKDLLKRTACSKIVSALNSITKVSVHSNDPLKTIATTQNGHIIIFRGNEIDTIIPMVNKKTTEKYFKKYAKSDKIEIIKAWWKL